MNITMNQFEVLINIEREKRKLSQRELAKMTRLSLGTINSVITDLTNLLYIDNNGLITEKGLIALEPFRVKRAIFLAAGFGSRMVPITLKTPKPLVKVNGKRIIETLLDAVVKAEIPEIIIVVGYLGEQFKVLQEKYPNITIITNNEYNDGNNILSARLIKDKLENAYVLDSDLLLKNPNLIRKYEYHSNYIGRYIERTDDWCIETKNGIITSEKQGGYNCYLMYGIAYCDTETGIKMNQDIEKVCQMPGGRERYWEQVMFDIFKKNYKVYVRECLEEDILEIDTFNELKEIDKSYNNFNN